jgi:hypothetical protein
MNLLLDLLNDAPLEDSNLPRNFHEAKKLVKSIGVGYNSIHACENDCVLYWKENVDLNSCPKCKVSRWKSDRKSLDGRHVYMVPKKVLCYFPIKKTLQRLFLSSKTASLTRWHDEDRKKDGLLRHPADSPLWQDLDERHLEFSADSQNIHLAFAMNEFNPFRKWKDFKTHLKKQYFDDKITDEQLKKMYGDRVNDSDWDYLITHWMSPQFDVRLVDIKFLLYVCGT